MRTRRGSGCRLQAAALGAVLAWPCFAKAQPAVYIDEHALQQRAEPDYAQTRSDYNDDSGVRVVMRGNRITLSGVVPSDEDRRKAVRAAREVYHAQVVDDLQVRSR